MKTRSSTLAEEPRHLETTGGKSLIGERPISETLYQEACGLMPGGVNSPVRAFRAVHGTPIFFERAEGAFLVDVDGNRYVDFVSSWGAIIHGHADVATCQAIGEAASRGTSFGASHAGEILLAREILERVAAAERIRFVNSGTEATLSAIRLARAATGRSKILKFEGNYHGAVDSLLAKAGSGVATFGLPDSAGVPAAVTHDTLLARYNDLEHVRALMEAHSNDLAAVLVEPVAGNMGLVPPEPEFLPGLRELCDAHGVLLIFDEVMTGFRISRGGASEKYGVRPDLFCFGKVIGGGLPVGAYAGSRQLMDLVAPVGPMYQAGTLSGNPLAMAAGYAAVHRLDEAVYAHLESVGSQLEEGLRAVCAAQNVPAQIQRVGSMISVFFNEQPVKNLDDANRSDKELFSRVFHGMLNRGCYLPPSALESWFLNASHTHSEIHAAILAFELALRDATSGATF